MSDPRVDLASSEEIPIIGGATTTIEEHPWQVSLQVDGVHFCGGSIVDPRWILTAQHCVDAVAAPFVVVAGVTRLSQTTRQVREIARVVRYPGYTSPVFGKDVALIELAAPLQTSSRVQAIRIATPHDVVEVGARALTTGWGKTGSGRRPDVLREAEVPVVEQSTVRARYGSHIGMDQIGAGGEGSDTCSGDSGGPLSVSSTRGRLLIGVTSWGPGCGEEGLPGMYARVSAFATWIEEHVGPQTTTFIDERALAGARGSFTHFRVDNVSLLRALLRPSHGDPDLYVRRGAPPTLDTFDCRPFLGSEEESCEVGAADLWFVSVHGYSEYSDAELIVDGLLASTGRVIASDDFAGSGWNGGFGFSGAWQREGDVALIGGAARLRRGTGDLRRALDVNGRSGVMLSFYARVDAFEDGDWALVSVSVDGRPFVPMRAIEDGDGVHAIDLSPFDGASRLVIRFEAKMNASTDAIYIDDVTLSSW